MKVNVRQQGMTLIELMVAMTIGLILTLGVMTALVVGENQQRATTSINDREQSGAYAALLLDRVLRSAGSGLAQTWRVGGYGCELAASKAKTPILPRSAAWPTPFAAFPQAPRVAPVLIKKGATDADSDVIMVLAGNAAAGDAPRPILSDGDDAAEVRLDGTLQIMADDIVLITQKSASECLIGQVASDFSGDSATELLKFGGAYYTQTSKNQSLSAMAASGEAYLSIIGSTENHPQFTLYGVDANRTLVSIDMLQMGGGNGVQAIADGVAGLYALYGIDTDGDGRVDAWVDPSDDYDIAALAADPARIRQILAIRFALVLRGAAADKEPIAQAAVSVAGKIELFADMDDATRSITLTDDERRYRYQIIDSVVPLRNALLAFPPPSPP
ncbi:MAG: PilW family protein [Betaproteobacteria bacterium]|nr:PilW family protein [Betaproteobacteria bacterium]